METKIELTEADLKVGQKVQYQMANGAVAPHVGAIVKIDTEERYPIFVDNSKGFGVAAVLPSEIKPILRRLDSMTTKEWEIYEGLFQEFHFPLYDQIGHESKLFESIESTLWAIDNNFDVRGWIKLGLAVDAATVEGGGK